MMSKGYLLTAAALSLLASPVAANSLTDAVKATLAVASARAGLDPTDVFAAAEANRCAMGENAQFGCNWSWVDQPIYHWSKVFGWAPLRPFYGFPDPVAVGECIAGRYCYYADGDSRKDTALWWGESDGFFGDLSCDDLKFENALGPGAVKVPSIPLPGGLPLNQPMNTWRAVDTPYPGDHADNPAAAALWAIHNRNMGQPKTHWIGCWRLSASAQSGFIDCVAPSRQDPVTGVFQPAFATGAELRMNTFHWDTGNIGAGPGTSKPCPIEGGGADFHYYSFPRDGRAGFVAGTKLNKQDGCTFYAPNYSLSISGYGYSETVEVRLADVGILLGEHPVTSRCKINPTLIRLLADRTLAVAAAHSANDAVTYAPVTQADVRVGATHPRAADLTRPIGTFSPTVPPRNVPVAREDIATPPGFVPSARPPAQGGDPGGSGAGQLPPLDLTSPTIADPVPGFTPPGLAMPDWFPSWDLFSLPEFSEQCPLFGFTAFDRQFELTGFCGWIEDNRVLIASIMVIVWAFSAYAIVLRA